MAALGRKEIKPPVLLCLPFYISSSPSQSDFRIEWSLLQLPTLTRAPSFVHWMNSKSELAWKLKTYTPLQTEHFLCVCRDGSKRALQMWLSATLFPRVVLNAYLFHILHVPGILECHTWISEFLKYFYLFIYLFIYLFYAYTWQISIRLKEFFNMAAWSSVVECSVVLKTACEKPQVPRKITLNFTRITPGETQSWNFCSSL